MDSRREFLKKAALLSGGTGLFNSLPASIQRALAIDPAAGSTFMDAEHVVILMQENRSFDHAYGSLKGVRGFNDPRAINLADGDPVWFQKNASGQAFAPFRLNIKETKSTWTGSLPHSWPNQVDARNNGNYDQWLIAKPSGHKDLKNAPLTMGYYNREDIPFYYSLADAFTVCDQNFCSSLTGTTPNRLYLWTGTIRAAHNTDAYANVRNENVDYEAEVNWKTFPDRLEDNGISWKIYQNEISLPTGFTGEEESWLANFTDNPIEWFSQFHVRFSDTHRSYAKTVIDTFPAKIAELNKQISEITDATKKKALERELNWVTRALASAKIVTEKYTDAAFAALPEREKNLHRKAFTTNSGDPDYRSIESYNYSDNGTERKMQMPKGDVLHQFRKDVNEGNLPAVSWVVGPENFSDHPGAPWYGAWYVSEVMDILTSKPEVWGKTIFILCYDENDGYFDHVPPYVAPDPYKEGSGKVSEGIDTKTEFVTLEQDMRRKEREESRESAIGLGYRVPLVIASPWSRGGQVNSQVFDHTSILMFLEKFLSAKTGNQIRETNITEWRRTVCGDLTSVFKPYNNEKFPLPEPVVKNSFYESVHKAQFLQNPSGYKEYSKEEITKYKIDKKTATLFQQEKGTRPSCAVPYELYADGNFEHGSESFKITMNAGNQFFGKDAAGSPFLIYAAAAHRDQNNKDSFVLMRSWNYAVKAGDKLDDTWKVADFRKKKYHLQLHGPNGFYREFKGDQKDPELTVTCKYSKETPASKKPNGDIELTIMNTGAKPVVIKLKDATYKTADKSYTVKGGKTSQKITIPSSKASGWYDLVMTAEGFPGFEKKFAGRVETGKSSITDPAMA